MLQKLLLLSANFFSKSVNTFRPQITGQLNSKILLRISNNIHVVGMKKFQMLDIVVYVVYYLRREVVSSCLQ